MRLRALRYVLVFSFFCIIAIWKMLPLVSHLNSGLPWTELTWDPLLTSWTLAWDTHTLLADPTNLFNANIFYPMKSSLALSDHLIGELLFFLPVYWLSHNLTLAYNLVFFFSFPLCGLTMFFLVEEWTSNFWASLVSGTLMAFAPIRFLHLEHLQYLNLCWLPLIFLFLHRYLSRKGWMDLFGFSACFWIQTLSCTYLGWIVLFGIVVYSLDYAVTVDRTLFSRERLSQYFTFVALGFVILFPLSYPYFELAKQWGFHRIILECEWWSADLLNYLTPVDWFHYSFFSRIHFEQMIRTQENKLFQGLLLPVLAFIGMLPIRETFLKPFTQKQRAFSVMLLVGFILSLGPYLFIRGKNTGIPLPYLFFYEYVPTFQAMRVPARFAFLVVLALVVLASLGFLRLSKKLSPYFKRWPSGSEPLLALFLIAVFLFEIKTEVFPETRITSVRKIPTVYTWLAQHRPGPVLEIPLGFDHDNTYMFYSTAHWLPLVNGASGFNPPFYDQMKEKSASLPSRTSVEYFGAFGTKVLVVHLRSFSESQTKRWKNLEPGKIGLKKIGDFDNDTLYEILPVKTSPFLSMQFSLPSRVFENEQLSIGILAEGQQRETWVHPDPLGITSVQGEWVPDRGGIGSHFTSQISFPLVIQANSKTPLDFTVPGPSKPGLYTLRLHFPWLDFSQSVKVL